MKYRILGLIAGVMMILAAIAPSPLRQCCSRPSRLCTYFLDKEGICCMDGYEMLDFVVNFFGCSSTEAYAYITLLVGGLMGGFVFFMDVFMDVGRVLARLLCDFVRWGYKKFWAKRKEP